MQKGAGPQDSSGQGAHGAHSLQGDRGHSPGSEGGAERDESRTKDVAAFAAGPGRPSVLLGSKCIWPALVSRL